MIDNKIINNTSVKWKRINMRNVEHLMGVEFMHDLYNRHEPKINSIRFRHTTTIWKDGIVNSYAPIHEWEKLGKLFGHQYYSLNPIIIEETKSLYRFKRKNFHRLIRQLQKTDLTSLDNNAILPLLINFQSIVLGELYVVNFVQIEHGLNAAIQQVINEITYNKLEAENLFIALIQTEKPTASQKEREKFCSIAKKWKLLKRVSLYNADKVKRDVRKHYEQYSYLYSAYGESPRSFEDFWSTFQGYLENKKSLPKKTIFPKLLSEKSAKTLKKLGNKKLSVLIPMLVQGGVFRDTNKALLGLSVKYRFLILDEITRRNLESRQNLDFYLLSEIADLLLDSQKISKEEIESRKNKGVVLTRSEDFQICTEESLPSTEEVENNQNILRGQCASRGVCTGKCKIVFTKKDAHKVEQGDIMIAIGTDFDLMGAMYRSAAIITEEGGILSHASVVCREIDKPCCIGVKNATKILKDGQLIKVDASKGEVYL